MSQFVKINKDDDVVVLLEDGVKGKISKAGYSTMRNSRKKSFLDYFLRNKNMKESFRCVPPYFYFWQNGVVFLEFW